MSNHTNKFWLDQLSLPVDVEISEDEGKLEITDLWKHQAAALISWFEFIGYKIDHPKIVFPDFSRSPPLKVPLQKIQLILNQSHVLSNREAMKSLLIYDGKTLVTPLMARKIIQGNSTMVIPMSTVKEKK